MRERPILFTGVSGREQAIVSEIPNLIQASVHAFGEPLLIADFVDQLLATDEHLWHAERIETENRALSGNFPN